MSRFIRVNEAVHSATSYIQAEMKSNELAIQL